MRNGYHFFTLSMPSHLTAVLFMYFAWINEEEPLPHPPPPLRLPWVSIIPRDECLTLVNDKSSYYSEEKN